MDDCFFIHRDSPQWLYKEDYCKGDKGFIIFILSNPKNISGGGIR